MKPYSPRSFFPSAAEFIFASAVVTLLGGQFLSAETWTGASSTDWTTGTNWTPVGTPDPYTDILINNQSLTNQPKLFAGDSSEVFNVAIFEGVLTVHGDLIVRDQIIVNSTGIMDISGGSVDSFVGSIGERIGSTGLVKVRAGGNWESLEVVLGGLGGGTLEIKFQWHG